jgi:hypothetical protein
VHTRRHECKCACRKVRTVDPNGTEDRASAPLPMLASVGLGSWHPVGPAQSTSGMAMQCGASVTQPPPTATCRLNVRCLAAVEAAAGRTPQHGPRAWAGWTMRACNLDSARALAVTAETPVVLAPTRLWVEQPQAAGVWKDGGYRRVIRWCRWRTRRSVLSVACRDAARD